MAPLAVAVTDAGGEYEYPQEVEYEVRQGTKGDYARAAELVNYKDVRWVSVQHEYGIFGGDDGAYILDFLDALRVPAVVTLHTVLDKPSESQRTIVQKMAKAANLVVMSQVALDLLARRYDLGGARVHMIPHGIPDMAPVDQERLKARFGVAGRRMLLTFGLLGPNKGIETVIRALPAAIAAYPDLTYFVVGATHPAVLRENGEAYRTTLEREAERLGVRDHVVFRDQYVTTEELCTYLQATDLFVSPYLSEAQVTSGALSYAMGAGAAVVSTPYWHAQELLADGRGCLFPFGDSGALADRITSILNGPEELARVRSRAYEFTRAFTWPRVGAQYLSLGATLLGPRPRRVRRAAPPRASSLPELRLDHLGAHDRRHRHHSARHLQRADPRERLLRRRQRPRPHRRAARRQADQLPRNEAPRRDLPGVPARGADGGRTVPEPAQLQPRLPRRAGLGGLHRARALGAGGRDAPGAG